MPVRSATCFCVRPCALRASRTACPSHTCSPSSPRLRDSIGTRRQHRRSVNCFRAQTRADGGTATAFFGRSGIGRPGPACRPPPLVLCQPVTVPDTYGADLKGLEPLLSIDDVARLLRVSESSVYRLVRSGELGRVKVGGRTLVEPGAVRAFIADCRDVAVPDLGQHPTTKPRNPASEAS